MLLTWHQPTFCVGLTVLMPEWYQASPALPHPFIAAALLQGFPSGGLSFLILELTSLSEESGSFRVEAVSMWPTIPISEEKKNHSMPLSPIYLVKW